MRPTTIRRLLVLGVCAAGVGALYLMPSVAGTPAQPGPRDAREPVSVPQPVGYVTQRTSAPSRPVVERGALDATPNSALGARGAADVSRTEPAQSPAREPAAVARGQGDAPDRQAPSTVADVAFPMVRPDRLTVRWSRAGDNVGVTSYRIWLNGYRVAETTELQVSVPWFNDGSRQQVVQVRAVDAAGNQSEDAPARLVERPAAAPTPTHTPTAPAGAPRSTPSAETVMPDTATPTDAPNG